MVQNGSSILYSSMIMTVSFGAIRLRFITSLIRRNAILHNQFLRPGSSSLITIYQSEISSLRIPMNVYLREPIRYSTHTSYLTRLFLFSREVDKNHQYVAEAVVIKSSYHSHVIVFAQA